MVVVLASYSKILQENKWNVESLDAYSDSQLMVNQVQGDYLTKDLHMLAYLDKVIISDNAKQFNNDEFKLFCSDLAISNHFSLPGHPQKTVKQRSPTGQNLKARLEKSKSKWAEDLLSVLWDYHTTSKILMSKMPYSLVYGTELVIPVEIRMPSFRMMNFDKETNEAELRLNLDLRTEKRKHAEVSTLLILGFLIWLLTFGADTGVDTSFSRISSLATDIWCQCRCRHFFLQN
ncbi:hypothetical protein Acr_12g0002610 [Actinidia rufa]|uniref:Uncharacterized protein n=1 Tax=Actinidia rufa TaxID=165716 RepID=A0A7J0FG93_9ERIC|nr:hypothetical protein Acr_12g0002610 [Actinidia rufa]